MLVGIAAQFVVLAFVYLYVSSPAHSPTWRVAVVVIYLASFAVRFIAVSGAGLASLLIQVGLGLALIIQRRWEVGSESPF